MARATTATSNPSTRIRMLEIDGPLPCARLAVNDVKENIAFSFCCVFPERESVRDSRWQAIEYFAQTVGTLSGVFG